jgi:hypothetical protein
MPILTSNINNVGRKYCAYKTESFGKYRNINCMELLASVNSMHNCFSSRQTTPPAATEQSKFYFITAPDGRDSSARAADALLRWYAPSAWQAAFLREGVTQQSYRYNLVRTF